MSIKGYKVFNPDWTCRDMKYEVGKTYKHDGPISICKAGFHFCQKVADCFSYYRFDPQNKVAEVEALGLVESDGTKFVTDEIKIVREIPWVEMLGLVNDGIGNTGWSNTGDYNTGYRNTGDCNTKSYNIGNWNSYESIEKSLTESVELVRKLQSQRWIPVMEQLPSAYKEVLLLFPHNQAAGFVDRDGCWIVYSGDGFYTEVADNEPKPTHWARKLLEPPKEE